MRRILKSTLCLEIMWWFLEINVIVIICVNLSCKMYHVYAAWPHVVCRSATALPHSLVDLKWSTNQQNWRNHMWGVQWALLPGVFLGEDGERRIRSFWRSCLACLDLYTVLKVTFLSQIWRRLHAGSLTDWHYICEWGKYTLLMKRRPKEGQNSYRVRRV
jgi:hypothetical protein